MRGIILLMAAIGFSFALGGCAPTSSGDDDDSPGSPATVAQICTKVFECGGFGWTDEAECNSGWLDNADYDTQCGDSSGYLTCAGTCLEQDCDGFTNCEADCWASHCEQ